MLFHFITVCFQNLIVLLMYQNPPNYNYEEQGGGFALIGLGIWLVSLFIVRWRISKHVLRTMNKASKRTTNDQPDELKASEIKAKNKPSFEDLSEYSNNDLAIEKRERFVRNAYLLFRKKYFYGFFAVLAYIVFPFGFLSFSGEPLSDMSMNSAIGVVVLYFLLINLNFYFYRKQFRAEDAHFGVRFEHPYVTVLRKIVNPTLEVFLTFIVIFMVFSLGLQEVGLLEPDPASKIVKGNTLFGIGLLIASLFHFLAFFKIHSIAQKEPNHALLVLRVFGNRKQTDLTFGKITNFWKHFGSWFTVVDTSLIKRQNRFFTFKTLFVLLILFFVAVGVGLAIEGYLIPIVKWFIPDKSASESEIREFAIIPGMIIAWILYLQYWRFKISRSYAKDIEDIRKKLHKTLKRPRKFNLTFKNLPMFCYDNTWKLAVSEFIKHSRAILMDLRGFSEERKGCEYEIDFLLDTFPINKILFLADAKNDQSLIQKTILERWEYLRENSPNISLKNPNARIFVSSTQDEEDVQSILDLLILSADVSN